MSRVTYRGEKQERLDYQLTKEHDYEVKRRVSQDGIQDTRNSRVSGCPWNFSPSRYKDERERDQIYDAAAM